MATFPTFVVSRVISHPATHVENDDDRGDRATFTLLYEREAPRIHRFLSDLLGDAALASDATQETFVRMFQHHRDVLHDRARVVPWLFGIARNVSLELQRARSRRDRFVVSDDDAVMRTRNPKGACPESVILGHEAIRVVDAALAKLSEDRRAVLLLRLDHGFSYDDIATLMGFSLSKVKVEIHRAREVLRETLDEYERAEPVSKGVVP